MQEPLLEGRCTENDIRERIEMANDDFDRLKEECPQFPLREDFFKETLPGRVYPTKRCERLEMNADGTWLEKAYCSYHKRWEFSHNKGLTQRQLSGDLVGHQRRTGKVLILVGVIFFPVGGFILLNDIENDEGVAPECMRKVGGHQIDMVHPSERAAAGFWLLVASIVWLCLVVAALAVCVWWLCML